MLGLSFFPTQSDLLLPDPVEDFRAETASRLNGNLVDQPLFGFAE
jgi:hypothetical protein